MTGGFNAHYLKSALYLVPRAAKCKLNRAQIIQESATGKSSEADDYDPVATASAWLFDHFFRR
jgi:hypothetical protein